jgi:DNA polymerase-4
VNSSMTKQIAHFDLDAFFVSVEQVKHPELKGKPVIVGGLSERGVVAACSYEARKFGVHSAMPAKMAKRLCPNAIFIRGDYESYVKYSDMVSKVLKENLPLLEKASIDEFYADMTGMDRFFGTYQYAQELRKKVKSETNLTISLGLSVGKTISKMVTNEAKPNGELYIPKNEVQRFLNPLAISKMPFIGDVTSQKLRNLGISNIGMLAQMPKQMLQALLGKNGLSIWERANGIDDTPVLVQHERKSVSKEMTFDKDTTDIQMLKSLVAKMVEELCYDIRKNNRCTGQIGIKIRYSNFDTHTNQLSIPFTASDFEIRDKVLDLLEKLYNRRLLVRLVGVRFSKLVPGHSQIRLFDDSADMAGLYNAMDHIRDKFGVGAVRNAYGMNLRDKTERKELEK